MFGDLGDMRSKQLWTIKEFAEWLRLTPMAVRGMLRRREFPEGAILKVGRRVRIRVALVQDWILKRKSA